METMDLFKKMSLLHLKAITHVDSLMEFVVISIDLLRDLEIAKMSKEETITIEVDGKTHKKLLNLMEAINENPK